MGTPVLSAAKDGTWARRLRTAAWMSGAILLTGIALYLWFPSALVHGAIILKRRSAGFTRHEILTPSGMVPYIEAGRGPPVMLLHGLEDNKDSWIDFATQLTDRYHVLIPDMHGFGENHAASNGDYRFPAQAIRMQEFLAALHIPAAHVAGVSMGGAIAGAFAASFPEHALSLAMFAPAGGVSDTTTGLYRRLLAGDNIFHISSVASVDTLFALIGDSGLVLPGFVKRAIVAEARMRSAQWDSILMQLREPEMLKLTDSLAPRITTRSLVSWGIADSIFHVSIARNLLAKLPNATLGILPDCGHLCVGTKARESGEQYRRFLDQ